MLGYAPKGHLCSELTARHDLPGLCDNVCVIGKLGTYFNSMVLLITPERTHETSCLTAACEVSRGRVQDAYGLAITAMPIQSVGP